MKDSLPVFLSNSSNHEILSEVAHLVPEGTQVYLFGGAVRNALYYDFFGEEMTQRDFDCIVIGDGEAFAKNLETVGFIYGSKNSEKAKILKKARVANPSEDYAEWLYLDCKIYPTGGTVANVLDCISDFTISGGALDITEINSPDWRSKVTAIPHALEDIHHKALRVQKPYPISIHKIIRMVSRGFQKPSAEDIAKCLESLKEITEKKFAYNTSKTIEYVGGPEAVQDIVRDLGITVNILSLDEIKNQ